MAKKKNQTKRASKTDRKFTRPDKTRRKVTHRTTTFRPNGGLPTSTEIAPETVTVGEAMRLAVEALGDVHVDDQLAPAQMRQLAEAYEQVEREKAAFTQKADAAKVAKKSLESATNLLLEKVRSFTHPAPLPLFDAQQMEDDEADMLAVDGDEAGA